MNREDKKRIGVRSLSLIALLLMAALLAACGGQSKPKPPPGSPDNPLVAQAPQDTVAQGRLNEAAPAAKGAAALGAEGAKAKADAQPGYQKLVERQGSKPRSRFTPCNLVTKAQARRDRRGTAAGPARGAAGPDVHLPLAGRQALRDGGRPVGGVLEAQAPDAQAPAG